MKFGENLYNLRKSKNMSQEVLAEKLNVSRQSVSKWETGVSYPEMNRIIELCKIFKCNINDLVNESILDYDSLDEEIKMNVVKFNEEKQKNLKFLSKTISVISNVFSKIALVVSIIMLISMFFIPTLANKISIVDNEVRISNTLINIETENTNDLNTVIEFINSHSKIELIIYTEMIIICLVITLIILYLALNYLSKLFSNINKDNTPFTIDNLNLIKKITYLFIIYVIFPNISGFIFSLLTHIDLNIEIGLIEAMFILILLCITYIFEYGHQIQLDSKGVIYGKEKE